MSWRDGFAARGEDVDADEPPPPSALSDERFESILDIRAITGRTTHDRASLGLGLRQKGTKVVNLTRITSRNRLLRAEVHEKENGTDDGKRRLPLTRAGCADVPRPCPHVGCRHHLYLDVKPGSGLVLNHPGREPDDLDERLSCSLDIAERGALNLDEIGVLLNVSRERIRQLEDLAHQHLRTRLEERGLTFEDLRDEAASAL